MARFKFKRYQTKFTTEILRTACQKFLTLVDKNDGKLLKKKFSVYFNDDTEGLGFEDENEFYSDYIKDCSSAILLFEFDNASFELSFFKLDSTQISKITISFSNAEDIHAVFNVFEDNYEPPVNLETPERVFSNSNLDSQEESKNKHNTEVSEPLRYVSIEKR